MAYEDNIPEFALRPAREQPEEGDGFDPTPYDRLIYGEGKDTSPVEEQTKEEDIEDPELGEEDKVYKEIEYEEEKEEIVPKKEKKRETVKIIPLTQQTIFSQLKVTDEKEKLPAKVYIEEDILVPDVKPDLMAILAMDATVKLSEREKEAGKDGEENVSIEGEAILKTIYLPEKGSEEEPIVMINSTIPFKSDWAVNVAPLAHMSITPRIDRIDYTVINERKFRGKITITLEMKEYLNMELDIFEGIKDEEVQILKKDVTITDIAARKRDIVDINEELTLKENGIYPEKILKYDISITENHRQITGEKAIINALARCNVLYLARGEQQEEVLPKLYQGKREFTHFVPLEYMENVSGSKVAFEEKDLKIRIAGENEANIGFVMEGPVALSLDVYKNITKGIVADIYHSEKDITYDMMKTRTRVLMGNGNTELSVRETINAPNVDIKEIIYMTGKIRETTGKLEKGRAVIGGIMDIKLICVSEEQPEKPFSLSKEASFHGAMDFPAATEEMKLQVTASIRDLWFDKISGKQIEMSGSIFASAEVMETREIDLMKNLCFIEDSEERKKGPSMVLYITKAGDTLWNIAKKYRTTTDNLKEINRLEEDKIMQGQKLLIVR